jgi:hypothetical protein
MAKDETGNERESDNSTLKVVTNAAQMSINGVAKSLEKITVSLNKMFINCELDLDKLPEYQKALRAMHNYENAVIKRLEQKYNEDK